METAHDLHATVVSWGCDLRSAYNMDGIDAAVADGLLLDLQQRGVSWRGPGNPAPANEGQAPLIAGLLRPAVRSQRVLSTLLRLSMNHQHRTMLETDDARTRTRLRSSGGATASKSLVAPAGLRAAHFTDEHVQEITWWRLGIACMPEEHRCQNYAASTHSFCHEPVNSYGDHAAMCRCGPLQIGRHNDLANALAECLEETGAHVRREAHVKEFSTSAQEAWLDIWAFGALNVQDLLIDVSIRHPTSSAYQRHAPNEDGAAASVGEEAMRTRYPASGGRSVTPFIVETWGRLGNTAEDLLQDLAAEATRRARQRGTQTTAGAFLRRWRATLDACLQRGIARTMAAARHGLPGRHHRE